MVKISEYELRLLKNGETSQRILARKYNTTRWQIRVALERWKKDSETTKEINVYENYKDNDMPLWKQATKNLPAVYRLAFLSDFHFPYHDPKALSLALKIVSDFNPNFVCLGGDVFEFNNISRWAVTPEQKMEGVLEAVYKPYSLFSKDLRDAAPNATIPFLIGNHDIRIRNDMNNDALAPYRSIVWSEFSKIIRQTGHLWFGFETTRINLGKLWLMHGNKTGMNVAKKHYEWLKSPSISGHTHKSDRYIQPTLNGIDETHVSGCLCKIKPVYSDEVQPWTQGIVLATSFRDGPIMFDNIIFKDNRAVWGAKVYKA